MKELFKWCKEANIDRNINFILKFQQKKLLYWAFYAFHPEFINFLNWRLHLEYTTLYALPIFAFFFFCLLPLHAEKMKIFFLQKIYMDIYITHQKMPRSSFERKKNWVCNFFLLLNFFFPLPYFSFFILYLSSYMCAKEFQVENILTEFGLKPLKSSFLLLIFLCVYS